VAREPTSPKNLKPDPAMKRSNETPLSGREAWLTSPQRGDLWRDAQSMKSVSEMLKRRAKRKGLE